MAFDDPSVSASVCGLSLKPPSLNFGFLLPPIPALPTFSLPRATFALSCSPSNPFQVSGDPPYGGGRVENRDPSPDTETE